MITKRGSAVKPFDQDIIGKIIKLKDSSIQMMPNIGRDKAGSSDE